MGITTEDKSSFVQVLGLKAVPRKSKMTPMAIYHICNKSQLHSL